MKITFIHFHIYRTTLSLSRRFKINVLHSFFFFFWRKRVTFLKTTTIQQNLFLSFQFSTPCVVDLWWVFSSQIGPSWVGSDYFLLKPTYYQIYSGNLTIFNLRTWAGPRLLQLPSLWFFIIIIIKGFKVLMKLFFFEFIEHIPLN